MPTRNEIWPELPYAAWKETYNTVHMWLQMAGKVRLACGPHLNHYWEATFYVTPRGLSSGAIPFPNGSGIFSFEFDFLADVLAIRTSSGASQTVPLRPCAVAEFEAEFMAALPKLGIDVKIWPMPVEVPDPVRFNLDREHCSYEGDAVRRWWRILVACQRVFGEVRGEFQGKSSPVHVFWGAVDLALTRFSGRPAPPRPNAERFMQEAYSSECASAGFWPGDGRFPEPAFYAYAVPEPPGYAESHPHSAAFYSPELGEFLLRYDDLRRTAAPDEELAAFLRAAYAAAAQLGRWDEVLRPT